MSIGKEFTDLYEAAYTYMNAFIIESQTEEDYILVDALISHLTARAGEFIIEVVKDLLPLAANCKLEEVDGKPAYTGVTFKSDLKARLEAATAPQED